MQKYYDALRSWLYDQPDEVALTVDGKPLKLSSFIKGVDQQVDYLKQFKYKDQQVVVLINGMDIVSSMTMFYAASCLSLCVGFLPEYVKDDKLDSLLQQVANNVNAYLRPDGELVFLNTEKRNCKGGHIAFSSGTGDYRSCVYRSADSWQSLFPFQNELFALTGGRTLTICGSIAYSGNLNIALGALYHRNTVNVYSSVSRKLFTMSNHKAKEHILYAVPTIMKKIFEHAPEMFSQFHTVITAGEPLLAKDYSRWRESNPNTRFIDFYGSVEVSYVSYRVLSENRYKNGSVGCLFPKVRVKVVDGLINVSSPYTAAFNVPYVSTKDVGKMDGNELILKGRSGNVISQAGKMVDLSEIEKMLNNTFLDAEFVATKRLDYDRGESFKLSVVQKVEGVDEHSIRDFLRNYGMPSSIEILEKWPLLSSGKINRRIL